MSKHFATLICILAISFSTVTSAQQSNGLFTVNRDQVLGKLLKKYLEELHYRKVKINDDLSQKAFDQYIEKLDYSKQFLLKSDVAELAKYKLKMDDQMLDGVYPIIEKSHDIMMERIKKAEALRVKFFKSHFTFDANESIEIDPKKRDFPKNEKEFEDYWRKSFKQSVLSRYTSILEDQEDLKNPKKKEDKKEKKQKKDKDAGKILTEKEMVTKAHEAISKKYQRYFERELQEERDDFMDKFYNSITEIFDPHTNYFAPKKKEDFDIDMSGSLEGIGAVLTEDEGYIKVNQIVPGGAAWRQKELEVDDLILAVSEGDSEDVVDLVGMRVDDAVRYIRGKKDTIVKLQVKKADGSRKTIPIKRDVVVIGASFTKGSVLELAGLNMKIGYIHVPKFYREFGGEVNCTADVKNELVRLKKQNVDGVILDLRNNGGGALRDAQEMSGLFIQKGPIVQIIDGEGKGEILTDHDASVEYNGPLIVMINRFSASASEIVAAAMQDYGRAVIVGGAQSHGKGTVQQVISLDNGFMSSMVSEKLGALKLTVQKFYRINGDSTQYKGVTPDIIIPDQFSYIENREKDLKYSLPWDRVEARKYTKWNGPKHNLDNLKKKSSERVKKNARLQKINENVAYLKKRKDDTKVTLNLNQWLKEEKENKKMVEKLKLDEENKGLTVTHFEESLKAHETVRAGEEKQWQEDFKQRKEDWVETLRKDAGLEEAMYILADLIEQTSKKMVYTSGK
ncbi:carboxy terminal-processing peptidase [Bacteriovorax sp. Seq25_V]|uniref:carboxy terminal-processing peptidase n=1 Tax=Bacteriovorax sp. Seq25_V TaxID=1201288 RepID=UPI00038A3812|nr:carboxy terminal-processing peptidase [Bacteriovorax sp. Seq25_V]EQC45360.1 peptidase, S41 family [Bacteriovorax sp. Seq25_V]